jgi:outer membrane protein OmpA-like peptidoglycan-associated protein
MYYLLLLPFLLLVSATGTAANEPVNRNYEQLRKQGDKLYAAKKYYEALPFYQKFATRYQDDGVNWSISDCFWNIGQFDSSLTYLQKLGKKNTQVTERTAEIFARQGNYQKAIQQYETLLGSADAAKKEVYNTRKKGFEQRALLMRDSLDWSLEYLSINTAAREFAPFIQKGQLYFVSNRNPGFIVPKTNAWDGMPYDDVYIGGGIPYLQTMQPVFTTTKYDLNQGRFLADLTPATSNDNNTLLPRNTGPSLGPAATALPRLLSHTSFKGHTGPVSMSADGQQVFFTRTSEHKQNGVYLLELCRIKKTGSGWSKPQVLSVNTKESSSFHPFYVESEKALLFCSDRAGGKGGSDIYRADLQDDGSFSEPVNMGSRINSVGDEGFPSVYNGILYYSSNGWPGLGGVDIYESSLKPSANQPKNMGYPINTSSDDYSLSFSGNNIGFIASNRYGSDDILRFEYALKMVTVKSAVTNASTGLRQEGIQVTLEQQQEDGTWKKIATQTTDYRGVYAFEVRPNQTNYRIKLSGKDFEEQVQPFDSKGVTAWKELNAMSMPVIASSASATQAGATGNSSAQKNNVQPGSTVFSSGTTHPSEPLKEGYRLYHYFDGQGYIPESHAALQEVIRFMRQQKDLQLEIVSAADCIGSSAYNLALSQKRAEYIGSLIPGDLRSRIKLNWVGNTKPEEPCVQNNQASPEDQQKNRYTLLRLYK